MSIPRILSSCLVAAALVGTPLTTVAEPASAAAQVTPAREAATVIADAERYAERERRSPAAATFEGGGQGVYIGSGVLTVVLIILLLIIIL